MMNDELVRAYCLENLQEAIGKLEAITKMFRSDDPIDEEKYRERMAYVYWCINLAWNCRHESWMDVEGEMVDQNNSFAEIYPRDLRPNDISN